MASRSSVAAEETKLASMRDALSKQQAHILALRQALRAAELQQRQGQRAHATEKADGAPAPSCARPAITRRKSPGHVCVQQRRTARSLTAVGCVGAVECVCRRVPLQEAHAEARGQVRAHASREAAAAAKARSVCASRLHVLKVCATR